MFILKNIKNIEIIYFVHYDIAFFRYNVLYEHQTHELIVKYHQGIQLNAQWFLSQTQPFTVLWYQTVLSWRTGLRSLPVEQTVAGSKLGHITCCPARGLFCENWSYQRVISPPSPITQYQPHYSLSLSSSEETHVPYSIYPSVSDWHSIIAQPCSIYNIPSHLFLCSHLYYILFSISHPLLLPLNNQLMNLHFM